MVRKARSAGRRGTGGGGGGGGGGGAATNAIIDGICGNASAASNGTITMAAITAAWARIETGTVYHFCDPSLMVGLDISPNI